ncbi:helix-turn-helix transcriptional regulator [Leucobacter sp. OH1287]|uniref:helix-turn-helix domain-containing protein n=1 Tax=Leucobacter sp. OH1287 TaxID=2491049 RepID=UPI0013150D0F|nr:helix-turn-helix transcriptional regulator [Leucobacter sp. OH1287]
MPIDTALTQIIKSLLDDLNISLRALSRQSDIEISRLSRCMRGHHAFVVSEVERVAAVFDMSASELVAEAEQLLALQGGATELLDATQSDYELVAKPLSPDTAAAVEYWDTLGEEPQ